MTHFALTVRRGKQWNEYYTSADTEEEARARLKKHLLPGWRIVSVENMDATPHYQTIFSQKGDN